ncbi:type II toxin-antitoxin system SpoIISA family toxin, partial [Bacillus sp. D-CC]
YRTLLEWHTEEEYTKSLNAFLDSYGEKIGAKIVVFEAAKELNTNFRGIRSQFSTIIPLEYIEQLNEQKAVHFQNLDLAGYFS